MEYHNASQPTTIRKIKFVSQIRNTEMFKFDSFLSFEKLEKIKQEKEADKRSLSLFEVEPYLSSISKTILKIRQSETVEG